MKLRFMVIFIILSMTLSCNVWAGDSAEISPTELTTVSALNYDASSTGNFAPGTEADEGRLLVQSGANISYTVNVSKPGWYKLLLFGKRDGGYNPSASITASVTGAQAGESLPRSRPLPGTDTRCTFGRFYLKEGENQIKLAVAIQGVNIRELLLKCIELDVPATAGGAFIAANDYYISSMGQEDDQWNYRGTYQGAYISGDGNRNMGPVIATGTEERALTYRITTSQAGEYRLKLYAACNSSALLSLESGGVVISGPKQFIPTVTSGTICDELVFDNFNLMSDEQEFKIKAKGTISTAEVYIYAFRLERIGDIGNTLSAMGETVLTTMLLPTLAGGAMVSGSEMSIPIGGSISFDINAEKAGNYKFWIGSGATVTANTIVRVYVDNTIISTQRAPVAVVAYPSKPKLMLGNTYISAGSHTIRFEVSSDAAYPGAAISDISHFLVKNIDYNLGAEMTVIDPLDFVSYKNVQFHTHVDQYGSTSPALIPNPRNKVGFVYLPTSTSGYEYFYEYSIYSDYGGLHKMAFYQSNTETEKTWRVLKDNVELTTAISPVPTGDPYHSLIETGVFSLDKGLNKLKIKISVTEKIETPGLAYIEIAPVPGVEFYDKDGNLTTVVTAGDMTAKANLNGYRVGEKVSFCFAVYKKEIGAESGTLYKAAMDISDSAADTQAFEEAIEGIVLEEGYEYEAKVFIWNFDNLYGECFATEAVQITKE
jgi:hypothetical protein